ncbi:polyprenyl synthetase family protein [Dysosmobacter sp. Phy]
MMDKQAFQAQFDEYRREVEGALKALFTDKDPWGDLYESMRYSLLAGGKRIRPVMVLAFARAAGLADWRRALPAACAVELVHTYSLIHDDLPCMDDDDLRRGKPTNHKVYGGTLAVLAGDALQPEAFRLLLTAPDLDAERRCACALSLAQAAGAAGMVAGQVLDTLHAPRTREEITQVHNLKTGAMIAGACRIGVQAAGGDGDLLAAAEVYGRELGLAFQIRDDLLDVVGNEMDFGKPIGSDAEEGKVTFANLLTPKGCQKEVAACTERAVAAVAPWDGDGFLTALAEALAGRER